MVKGVAVNFKSYEETIPKLLELIKFPDELKKHDKIVLKPNLANDDKDTTTNPIFVESVLKFCMENKNPGTEIFLAEGSDGFETAQVFDDLGYTQLAEKYGIGLIDLNNTETEEIESENFLKFDTIHYPKILLDSFVISLPSMYEHREIGLAASIDNMVGAFPAKHYKGFFSSSKNKIKKYPVKYQIHDIIQCKMPDFAIIDGSDKNTIIAGQPFEMDKQASKALGINWQEVDHLKLLDESLSGEKGETDIDELIGES